MILTEHDKTELRKTLRLSPRQIEIVQALLDKRFKDAEIAEELGLSFRTIGRYLAALYDKVGVPGKLGLVLRVLEVLGYISP